LIEEIQPRHLLTYTRCMGTKKTGTAMMISLVGDGKTVDVFLTREQMLDLYSQLESAIKNFNLGDIL
jgi:hypothetical protein